MHVFNGTQIQWELKELMSEIPKGEKGGDPKVFGSPNNVF